MGRNGVVKPVSRKEKHQRIRDLKCYKEVHERLLEGWPVTEIVKFIRDIKKESLDITPGTLELEIRRYRADIPPAELTKNRLTKTYMAAVEKVEEGIDELQEMQKLYRLQMERLQIDFAHEKKINKLMPTTGQEVRIAKEVLSSYAQLKMDLGVSKRHIGLAEVDARVLADVAVRHEAHQTDVQQVLANPQSRKKVLGLVEKLLNRSTATTVGDNPDIAPALPEVIDMVSVPDDHDNSPDDDPDLFPEFDDNGDKDPL